MASALAPSDVDAQATVTDFSDYTEYLRSDLFRSLTLIHDLDLEYRHAAREVDRLTRIYGDEKLVRTSGKTPLELRAEFSQKLDRAISSRECAFAEAQRLFDTCDRHAIRLSSILTKLQALPLPPSRDPTPAPQPSPVQQRITLRFDPSRAGRGPRYGSPGMFDDSDWDMRSLSPIPMATGKVGEKKRGRPPKHSYSGTIRLSATPRPPAAESHLSVPRPPRSGRLFAISSTDAIAALEPPPLNAKTGTEHAPWLRLTMYELAVLRKKMKKNSEWQPSDTMIHRELKILNRGIDAHKAEVQRRIKEGQPPLAESLMPTADQIACGMAVPPAVGNDGRPTSTEQLELYNRGVKLNEAKKVKKEAQARLAAEMATANSSSVVTTEAAMLSISNVSRQFQDLQALLSKSAPPSPLPLAPLEKPKKSPTRATGPVTPVPVPVDAVPAGGSSDLPLRSDTNGAAKSKKRKRSEESASVDITKATSPAITITISKDGRPVEAPQMTGKSTNTISTLALTAPPLSASSLSSRPRREGSVATITPVPPPETYPVEGKAAPPLLSPPVNSETPRLASASQTPIPPPTPVTASNSKQKSFIYVPTAASSRPVRERKSLPGSISESTSPAVQKPSITPGRRVSPPRISPALPALPAPSASLVPFDILDVSSLSSLSSQGELSEEEEEEEESEDEETTVKVTEAADEVEGEGDDEERYCICQQESHDTMIACDNETCEIEWFHLSCVGLKKEPPDGRKWFCPNCRDGKDDRRLKRTIVAARKKEAEDKEKEKEREAQAMAEAQARAEAEAHARAQAEAKAKAQAEAKAKARAEAEAQARAQEQARAQAQAQAQAEAEAKAQAQAQAEAQAKAQAQAKTSQKKQKKSQKKQDKAPITLKEAQKMAFIPGFGEILTLPPTPKKSHKKMTPAQKKESMVEREERRLLIQRIAEQQEQLRIFLAQQGEQAGGAGQHQDQGEDEDEKMEDYDDQDEEEVMEQPQSQTQKQTKAKPKVKANSKLKSKAKFKSKAKSKAAAPPAAAAAAPKQVDDGTQPPPAKRLRR